MVEQKLTNLDRTFGALANPTRRSLMDQLAQGEATVTQLAKPYSMSLAAVSKHLGVLHHAGLVRLRAEGRQHWFSLNPEPLGSAVDWLFRYREFWQDSLDALETLLDDGGWQ